MKEAVLVANEFKDVMEEQSYLGVDDLKDSYAQIEAHYAEKSEAELDVEMTPNRRKEIDSMNWSYGGARLSELKVWDGMQGLDKDITGGSVIDIARNIEGIVRASGDVSGDFLKKASEIHNYNERGLNAASVVACSHESGMRITDGNSRSVAAALGGNSHISAYIGTYKNAA